MKVLKRIHFKTWIFISTLLLTVGLFWMQIPLPLIEEDYEESLEGTIIDVQEHSITTPEKIEIEQTLTIQITQGTLAGESVEILNQNQPSSNPKLYKEGDDVIVIRTYAPNNPETYYLADHIRRSTLYKLFALFLLVVIGIAGKQGLTALLGMGFSFLVILKLTLPLLLIGKDPIQVGLLSSVLIIPITFYLSHGVEKKTHFAVLGTICSLLLTMALSKFFMASAYLTGLSDESAFYLKIAGNNSMDFQGLLLAGILISMLGVLDDVAIAQASVAQELEQVHPKIPFQELFSRCMNVGKDHISSVVNTLILIYTGASLPLLLLFLTGDHSFFEVINYESVAKEIMHTLIGSIGLIFTVPITTFLATCHKLKK